jgi:hypothetical protein
MYFRSNKEIRKSLNDNAGKMLLLQMLPKTAEILSKQAKGL